MRRNQHKFLRLLSIGLILSMLAGCMGSQKPVNVTAPSTPVQLDEQEKKNEQKLYQLGHEPLQISFYGHYNSYTMPIWGADPSSKWIQDQFNIHIKGINSDGNAKMKLQKMIAGKQLPDIIWGDRDYDLERMRQENQLVPLDKYIEKYPHLKQWAGEKILNLLRSSDGKIYYFPNYYTNRPYGNAGYVINKKYIVS